jgi:hypothetical protein
LPYRKRNRTSVKDIGYSLYLYFLGLSYRNTAKALSKRFIKRSIMFPYGSGFSIIDQKRYSTIGGKCLNL